MEYTVRVIDSKYALEQGELFHVDHFLWNCRIKPRSYGRMGYIPGEGLYLRMISLESGPKRVFRAPGDPVCRDSAMECFLAPQPDDDGLYLNFEINANGAMYAKYGHGRKDRKFIEMDEYEACRVHAEVWPDFWGLELHIPLSLLARVGFAESFQDGDVFYCNFYKISEDPGIEHYGAFHPVQSETPNFHLPRFFARAVMRQ